MSLLDPTLDTSRPLVDIDLGELAAISRDLETQPASAAIRWAWDRFGDEVVLAASFQDCVLVDIAAKAAPGIEVVFLDTQYHFAETLWYVDRVRERYDLNLTVMEPLVPPDDLWQVDPDEWATVLTNLMHWTYQHLRQSHGWSPERSRSTLIAVVVGGVRA